jgi:hypothetical protein
MFKKLIAAVFVLSILLALSTAAFAFKDPNHMKPLPGTLPDALRPGAEFNVAAPEQPPQYSKPYSAAQQAMDVTGPIYREPTVCDAFLYHDGTPFWFWPIPDDYGDDFFNMRFTPNVDEDCRLATVALMFYDGGSTVVSADGIEIIVWDDDGFGFPGVERGRIAVPASSMVFYPYFVVVDFSYLDLHYINNDFHVGYTTVNQVDDVYAVLSDEGTTGTLRSSEFYLGMWGTMYNDWGLDVNFIIEADLCCTGGAIANCEDIGPYGTGVPYYYWTIPDPYGDDFFNERLTNVYPDPGTLTVARIGMYAGGSVDVTGEGIDLMVWDDDGAGFPGTLRQVVNIPTASIAWYPAILEVDMRPYGVTFSSGQEFHIGYTTVNQGAGNVMACLSDDGSGPAEYRSSEWWGVWGLMIDDWGVDVDFIISAELCFGDPPPPPTCDWIAYNGDAYYYWTIPDPYGDDYFNMRFTHLDACTVKTLEIAMYAGGSVGAPGADFIVFNSNGTYPTDTIAVYPVNPVTTWFPGYESVDCSADNLEITGDFHLGYTPIYNDPGDVLACLSDDGSVGTGRSSEWWGIWGLMVDDWGVDVNFLMQIYSCCPTILPPTCIPEDDWPTLSHDYARTGYSQVEVGSLCGFQRIWHYWSPYDFCYFANPIIADQRVYATFGVHLECFDLAGGSVWSTTTIPAYGNILGGQIRTTPTVEDGYIYFSGGTFESFVKADAATGAIVWSRGGITGPPLEGTPGAMRFCPSVIVSGLVYVGGDGGTIYALDVTNGNTIHFQATPYGNSVWVSPSTDGSHIYFGCAIGWTGGDSGAVGVQAGLYQYALNLTLISPYLGNIGWDEGVTSGATYSADENALYFQTVYAQPDPAYAGTDAFTQKADAATMGPHADNSYFFCGPPQYSNPAINPNAGLVYFGNVPNRDDRFEGMWCKTFTFNTAWQDFTKGAMTGPAGSSCDYVFWGSRQHPAGRFNCNTPLGDEQFSYILTGYGFGPAIAKYDGQVYVAQTQLWSDCGTGGGRLTMYSQGADRPRLIIPAEEVLIDPPLDFIDPDGTERSADIFCNGGCIGMNYCLALEAHASYPTRNFGGVNPKRLTRGDQEADRIVEYSLNDFDFMDGWKEARMQSTALQSEYGDRQSAKDSEAYTASAPPSWVTLVSPAEGMVRVADCYEATFAFTVTAMSRGQNLFYVQVATDDPDYNECDLYGELTCGRGLPINTMVLVNAVKGFAFCDGYVDFGDGGDDWEYMTNAGYWDDGSVDDAFTVDGGDDPMYQGGFYYAVDSNRVAWNEEGGNAYNHLFPDSLCGQIENTFMDEMYYADGSSVSVFGDYFESSVIDSMYDQTTGQLDGALTMGMRLSYREWGAFGPDFNNFVVIAYDLYNRNATPVDDLYFGCFADWDMPGDGAGYEQVDGDIGINVAYQFNEVSGEIAGYGCLPLADKSVVDGVVTTGMYNGYGISNPDQIYNSLLPDIFFSLVDDCPEGDWCYHPNAAPGAPVDDRGMILTALKNSFGDSEVVSGAVMKWYYPGGATIGEIEDMMNFADKFCGYQRGDCNNDGEITLNDLVILILYLNGGNSPWPWTHMGDVDGDGNVDADDALYFYNFFFMGGAPPVSKLVR